MNVTINCVLCDAEHEFDVDAGEARTHWYPGSPPQAHHIEGSCDCSLTVEDENFYWALMERKAREAAEEEGDAWENPFDTVEELMGER